MIFNHIPYPVVFSYIESSVISDWARHIELLLEDLQAPLELPALRELVFFISCLQFFYAILFHIETFAHFSKYPHRFNIPASNVLGFNIVTFQDFM